MPYSAVPPPDQPSQIRIILPELSFDLASAPPSELRFSHGHMQPALTKSRLLRDLVRVHARSSGCISTSLVVGATLIGPLHRFRGLSPSSICSHSPPSSISVQRNTPSQTAANCVWWTSGRARNASRLTARCSAASRILSSFTGGHHFSSGTVASFAAAEHVRDGFTCCQQPRRYLLSLLPAWWIVPLSLLNASVYAHSPLCRIASRRIDQCSLSAEARAPYATLRFSLQLRVSPRRPSGTYIASRPVLGRLYCANPAFVMRPLGAVVFVPGYAKLCVYYLRCLQRRSTRYVPFVLLRHQQPMQRTWAHISSGAFVAAIQLFASLATGLLSGWLTKNLYCSAGRRGTTLLPYFRYGLTVHAK